MIKQFALGFLIFIGGMQTCDAKTITIYTWQDANGIMHYSQMMPEGIDFTTMDIREPTPPKVEKNIPQVKENAPSLLTDLDKQTQDNCKKSQENLRVLAEFDNIKLIDEQGNETLLTEADKVLHQQLAEKKVKLYCQAIL
ncbi:DUF4124 domain-containing protein [Pseudoalteromonas ulvae]|uniref:DUF4124 domain-containing protein n=1 Tax=Pseudoalteromonas ulvae TaxID=107327 RepID=A0A244CUW8_PSEDV|nr:DUF4124 domain-containing protein [Pseudoalteromonas ulvae]OUL59422.1 hypothetical protein B1199_03895 [Pseudoalteromonas ulvae]